MEDIERIEVFRGPNTVSYGANALMAVVNIITRRPADSHGTRMKVTQGQRGINDFYASQGVGWRMATCACPCPASKTTVSTVTAPVPVSYTHLTLPTNREV